MERIYYPNISRVLLAYLSPAIALIIVYLISSVMSENRKPVIENIDWLSIIVISFFWIGSNTVRNGFRAKKLAIKLNPSSIEGLNVSGEKESISFNKIDFQKTLNPTAHEKIFLRKRIYSLEGSQIEIQDWLFEPKQIAEIFATIKEFDERHKSKQ